MAVYQIFLADDHQMFRTGLRTLIERQEEFRVVDEASDGDDLLKKLPGSKCDVVLLDLSMPKLGGMDALPLILKRYPKVRVLVLTMQKDAHYCQKAMDRGAAGYLLKDDAFEQLVKAMKAVIANERFVSPSILHLARDEGDSVAKASRKKAAAAVLSGREQEVLRLVAAGLANKNIAKKLNISIRTVEVHRSNLIRKLNIKTTAGLVRYAMEHSLGDEGR